MKKIKAQICYTFAYLTLFVGLTSFFTLSSVHAETMGNFRQSITVLDSQTLSPIAQGTLTPCMANKFEMDIDLDDTLVGEQLEPQFVIVDKASQDFLRGLSIIPKVGYEMNEAEKIQDISSGGVATYGVEKLVGKNKKTIVGVGAIKFVSPELLKTLPDIGVAGVFRELKNIDGVQGYIKIKFGAKSH